KRAVRKVHGYAPAFLRGRIQDVSLRGELHGHGLLTCPCSGPFRKARRRPRPGPGRNQPLHLSRPARRLFGTCNSLVRAGKVSFDVRPTGAWEGGMKAIRLHARGGPEAFVYEEAPQPHPEEGEVLVRVHAAAVTPTELSWVPTWTMPRGEP